MNASSADIRTQIQQVERARHAAIDAEAERQFLENANRRAITERDSELARLRQAEREATIGELKASHGAKIQTWQRECEALIVRLEAPDLKLSDITPALLNGVGTAYNACQNSSAALLSGVQELAFGKYDERLAQLTAELGEEYVARRQVDSEASAMQGKYISGMQNALSPTEVLYKWQAKATKEPQKRIRAAVVYLLTGQFVASVNPNYSPGTALTLPRQW